MRGRHVGHGTGYDCRWEASYKWVFYVEGEGLYMYVLAKHESSIIHREALQHEHASHVVKVQGGNAGAGGALYFKKML